MYLDKRVYYPVYPLQHLYSRDCNSCMRDLYCGFCYMDVDKGSLNGSCLQSDYNNPLTATNGRCNHTELPGIIHAIYWVSNMLFTRIWLVVY